MRLTIRTKKDTNVNKEQLAGIIERAMKFSEQMNEEFEICLETTLKFEKK